MLPVADAERQDSVINVGSRFVLGVPQEDHSKVSRHLRGVDQDQSDCGKVWQKHSIDRQLVGVVL